MLESNNSLQELYAWECPARDNPRFFTYIGFKHILQFVSRGEGCHYRLDRDHAVPERRAFIFAGKGSGNNEVARFTPGDIIGDFDFARDAEYDVYAEALEDSTLIVFPGSGLFLERFAVEELSPLFLRAGK